MNREQEFTASDESHEEETLEAKLEEERENECVAASSATNPKIT